MGCTPSKEDPGTAEAGGKGFSDLDSGAQKQTQGGGSGSAKQSGRYASNGGKQGASSSAAASASASSLGVVHSDIVFSVCSGGWSNDGATASFFSGSEDNAVAHWDRSRLLHRVPDAHSRCISDMAYCAPSRMLYTASRDKSVKQWRVDDASGALTAGLSFSGHTLPVTCVDAPAHLPSRLVSGARDYHVRVWDVEKASTLFWTEVQQNVVTDVVWLAGEECVLQASEDLTLRLWDTRTRQVAQSFDDGPYFALHASVSADNNYFLTGHNGFEGVGCEMKLFDRRAGKKIMSVQAGHQALTDASFVHVEGAAAGHRYAATSSKDGSLRLWDLEAILAAGEASALSGKQEHAGLLVDQQMDLSEVVQCFASAPSAPQAARAGHATLATGHINGRVSLWDFDVQRRSAQLLMQSQGQAE